MKSDKTILFKFKDESKVRMDNVTGRVPLYMIRCDKGPPQTSSDKKITL